MSNIELTQQQDNIFDALLDVEYAYVLHPIVNSYWHIAQSGCLLSPICGLQIPINNFNSDPIEIKIKSTDKLILNPLEPIQDCPKCTKIASMNYKRYGFCGINYT